MLKNKLKINLGMPFMAFLLIFLLASCVNSKQAQTQDDRQLDDGQLIITQQRLMCMGLCPVYLINIYSNGKVEFTGEENVPKTGSFTMQLSKEDLQDLVTNFDSIDFFGLKKEYTKDISDGSTTYISYKKGGNELKIMDYYGAPQKLKDLEQKVETLIFSYLNK
jgi:hypothetical protein